MQSPSRKTRYVAARALGCEVARRARAEPLVLLPHVRERHREAGADPLDQRLRVFARAVVGHDHLEAAVGLRRHAFQHGAQGVGPVVGRHRDGQRDHLPPCASRANSIALT